ncbi:MAG: trypsin-like peptidase domain-containing protein [Anaerolineae bacterium]
MNLDVAQSVALITSKDPDIHRFGTGFVVHRQGQVVYLLTCAHVVNDVGGPQQVKVGDDPATVIACGGEDAPDDLAVLQVEGRSEIPSLPLGVSGETDRPFVAVGFQLFGKSYLLRPIRGRLGEHVGLESRGGTERIPAWDLKIEDDYHLQPGYSGSPVVDETTGTVLGMVSHRQGEGRRGLALSIEAVSKVWPDMPPGLVEGRPARSAPGSSGAVASPVDPQPAAAVAPGRAIAPNPFGDTGQITDPERFFDREELLRQVFEELGKGVNLSLVGRSQIGKSSILWMISALGPQRMDPVPEAFAYLSLEWVDDEDDFYEALADVLGLGQPLRGYRLRRALAGRRLVLCLDEMEKMAWEGFSVYVRSQLRGLADGDESPLKLVIASRSPLSRLFPDSPELDSPLAGICHQLNVNPFPPDVARDFLAHRLQGSGVTFTAGQIDSLLAESGGHPADLQRLAADLYRRVTGGG